MTQLGFYFDQTRCTGCYACAVACKDWYDIDQEPVKWMRVTPIEYGKFPDLFAAYMVSPCYHCLNPPCMLACPEDAILKREIDGIVFVDQTKCVGKNNCKNPCLKACLWNVPQFGVEENPKMQKCNLCMERIETGQRPVCVEACPMLALDAGPIDQLKEKYGNINEAEGFRYSEKFKPSAIFKPKRYT
jgi:anaerobic dimethyl sulfoxide reductase subunit B (iron-sulfur subunit)